MLSNTNSAIGNRIAQLRKIRGLKQSQLGKKIGVTASAIGNYERGQRVIPADMIGKISKALQVPSWLISDGIPAGAPPVYDLQFFADASDTDLNNFSLEMSMLAQQDVEEDAEDSRKFIAETAQDLIEIREFGALKVLKGFAKLIRENVTNKQRVEQASDKSIIKIDPFKEADEERAHNIKSPRYHMYFLDPVQKELYSLIKERRTAGDKETADRLQKVLDKIERENFRV